MKISNERGIEEIAKAYSAIKCEAEALQRKYMQHKALQNIYAMQTNPNARFDVQEEINDCLILFCVHARNLANFFLKDCTKRTDDIKIEDFGLSYSIFDQLSSDGFSKKIVDKISKEVSHLTYKTVADYETRLWDTDEIFGYIIKRYQIFCEKIHSHHTEIATKSLEIDSELYKKIYSNME